MQDLGSKIKAKGWRQGSILYDQDLADLQREYMLDGDCNSKVGVVVSQSCDLTHHDSESEPYTELLLARIVNSRDGNFKASTLAVEFSRNQEFFRQDLQDLRDFFLPACSQFNALWARLVAY